METTKTSEELRAMTTPDLEARGEEVAAEIAKIKGKLDKVRADLHITGEWVDPDWYRRTKSRVRHLGVEHQVILRILAERKRAERLASASTLQAAFMTAARKMLSGPAYMAILETAQDEVSHGG